MKQQLLVFFRDPIVNKLTYFFIVLIIGFIILAVWKWNSLPPQLPLFFSLPRGEEQLVNPIIFMLLPVISILFFVTDFFLGILIYQKRRIAAYLLVLISDFFTLLLFITYLKIILLVT